MPSQSNWRYKKALNQGCPNLEHHEHGEVSTANDSVVSWPLRGFGIASQPGRHLITSDQIQT